MATTYDDRREVPRRQVANVRKRTKQACDRCSSLRVRCDGRHPCHRCHEYEQNCFYTRNIGKRGRKPRTKPERAQVTVLDESHYEDSSDTDQCPDEALQRLPHPDSQAAQNQSSYRPATERPNSLHASLPGMMTRKRYPDAPASSTQPLSAGLAQHYHAPALELAASQSQDRHEDAGLNHGHDDLLFSAGIVDSPALTQDLPLSFPYGEVLGTRCADHNQHPSPLNPPSDRTQPESQPSRTYKCLEPILPMLHGIVDEKLACELLEMYFLEPGGSLFRCASPYVLTHVLRKESLLRSDRPRRTTPALLTAMLWVSAQTAQSTLFLRPGQKTRVCEELRKLMLTLIRERDQDSWDRNTGGTLLKYSERSQPSHDSAIHSFVQPARIPSEEPPAPSIDDVLAFVLLTIVLSGGDFKTDCFRWWNKALRLSRAMGLNREDIQADVTLSPRCTQTSACTCRACEAVRACISVPEVQEERRRVFWLMFCMDRHLALSHNSGLNILDDECHTYCPLPDDEWEFLASPAAIDLGTTPRTKGPPTRVSGTGFFEYFLPLMAILGDIIQLHHRKYHPRFGCGRRDEEQASDTALVEGIMAECERSIADMATRFEVHALDDAAVPGSQMMTPTSATSQEDMAGPPLPAPRPAHFLLGSGPETDTNSAEASTAPVRRASKYHRRYRAKRRAQAQLVTAYSTFILHVLHVLLHGKWDAVSMLENTDGWISSPGFMKCASHSIAASDAVSRILACDPELSFMPYLFGIYLLHGSFILLLFADRMPQLGPNESVERACEIIIRAHEVCVVTLSTEFQIQFRKVIRSTLYSVRSAVGALTVEESAARLRALSVYRWCSGFTGLAV